MEIIIIGTAQPFRGGIAAFNERLAKEYIKQGHTVKIYTFTTQYPNFLFPGKTQYTNQKETSNLSIKRSFSSIHPFSWIKTGREIKKLQADLIIIPYWLPFMAPSLGSIARIIKKNKKSKIISLVHNIIPHEKRFFDKCLSNYFVNSVDGFISLSQAVLDDIDIFDSQKPRIFSPHPLYDHFGEIISKDLSFKKLGLDPNYQYFLFFGFIRDYKGLDLLMKSYLNF